MRERSLFENLSKLDFGKGVKNSKEFFSKKRDTYEIKSFIKNRVEKNKNKEVLVMFLRRHWLNLLGKLLPVILMVLFIFILYFILIPLSGIVFTPNEWGMIRFVTAIVSVFIWAFLFVKLVDYYLDIWIITDRRIVNIEQKGLFRREVSELRIMNVQDVTTDIRGIIPTLFDYGDLYVQTAAKRERFLFRRIPKPGVVKDIIVILSDMNKD